MSDRGERISELECLRECAAKQGKTEAVRIFDNLIRCEKALSMLDWETIKQIRNANGYKLFPLDWSKVYDHFNYVLPFDFHSQSEFEARLKEVCESLYGWKLYEPCPKCGKGILVPIWCSPRQYTPFCGCSEYPRCDYSEDREKKPISAY